MIIKCHKSVGNNLTTTKRTPRGGKRKRLKLDSNLISENKTNENKIK